MAKRYKILFTPWCVAAIALGKNRFLNLELNLGQRGVLYRVYTNPRFGRAWG
jgi:hypothetical protein